MVYQSSKEEYSAYQYEQPPILFGHSKNLYIASGANIEVYNPLNGKLLQVLKGHDHKIVSLVKDKESKEETLISCDEKGKLNYWKINTEDGKNICTSFVCLQFGKENFIENFGLARKFGIVVFREPNAECMKLFLIKPPFLQRSKYLLTKELMSGQKTVAVNCSGNCIAANLGYRIFTSELSHKGINKSRTRYHRLSLQCLKIVAHPSKDMFALAFAHGAVQLWYHILERSPVKVQLHWHTLPASDISFSPSGGDLYSGGSECVVVRWRLRDDNKKSFLPRLGMPIISFEVDQTDTYGAVYHEDKSVTIINTKEMRVSGRVHKMASHVPLKSNGLLSIGLLYHAPTAALVKNGQTGHLLFFNPELLKMLFNVDITMCNFATANRQQKMPNPEITTAAMSEDGLWLVTNEICPLTSTMKEYNMKFWYFSPEEKRWELNTNIQMPHLDTVNSISMRPTQEDDDPMCVSCSDDGKMKIWKLISYEDVLGKKRTHWNSRCSKDYRNLPATASAFSGDGSLLAVAFESTVTLWTPDSVALVGSLSQFYLKERIRDINFSYGKWEGAALIYRTDDCLCSWDLLSCTLRWRFYVRSSCMAVDRITGLISVFVTEGKILFFDAHSTEPISVQPKVSEKKVVCAVFAPLGGTSENASGRKRRLYCFDADQEFFSLDDPYSLTEKDNEGSVVAKAVPEQTDATSSLVSALVAKTRVLPKEVNKDESSEVAFLAPSVNSLFKDLNSFRVHSLSFLGLVDHISSFLPDLSSAINSKNVERKVDYRTIEEEKEKELQQKESTKFRLVEEDKTIERLHEMDFGQIIKSVGS